MRAICLTIAIIGVINRLFADKKELPLLRVIVSLCSLCMLGVLIVFICYAITGNMDRILLGLV